MCLHFEDEKEILKCSALETFNVFCYHRLCFAAYKKREIHIFKQYKSIEFIDMIRFGATKKPTHTFKLVSHAVDSDIHATIIEYIIS